MKIGYPCINRTLRLGAHKTFKLSSYSPERLVITIKNNLDELQKLLEYTNKYKLLFFRISSGIIPFASHSIMDFDWRQFFAQSLKELGTYSKQHAIRISMHPDQFVVLNSPTQAIVTNSIKELEFHAELLDSLELDHTAKIQIHIGGLYNDKEAALKRFIETYKILDSSVKKRLVIENDDRLFSLKDCLRVHSETGIPIILDVLHHECLHNGEPLIEALQKALATWQKDDGVAMIDYSTQEQGCRTGKHAETLNTIQFTRFLQETAEFDFDIMLEIKDKERSALKALAIARQLGRITY